MNPVFQCPRCRNKLSNLYVCSNCSRVYFNEEGFFDFINSSLLSTGSSEKKLSYLLSKIHSHGYSQGLLQFLKNNSEFEYRFDKMEGSLAFRVIRRKNTRCLVLNSDLGNIPENLSQVFDEVYSLDTDKEKILIQKFRFQENNIDNTILIRSDVASLPFPNKYFDLVVLYGIKICKKDDDSPKTTVIEYFKEIKRVLASGGCLCAGLGNKYGLKKYASKMGYDIHNETYSDSFYGYNSIFSSLGFQVKSYWVLPSYRKPHYSGNIEDGISLKWFFRNFDIFLSVKMKFGIFRLLKRSNAITSKLLMKLFSPSFLFYCYNEEMSKVLEDMMVEKTGFKNLIQLVSRRKIMYILLDSVGNPKKKLFCKSMKYDLTEKIVPIRRNFSKMEDLKEKIVIEDWFGGDALDPLNSNDINLVMKWLTDFQKSTSSELFSSQEIEEEIENLKNDFDKIEEMTDLPYYEWLDEYRNHISGIKLKKTAVHGNLHPNHILVDRNNSSVNIIDWDDFQEKGNPLFDFMRFAITIMMWSNDWEEQFRSNLNGVGRAVPVIKIIKEIMNVHFQADLDFIILLRFFILKWISFKTKLGPTVDPEYITVLKILSSKKYSNSEPNRKK